MSYPRMKKDEYPAIPEEIRSESDYKLVLEYVVFSAMMIEDLQDKAKNPFMPIVERRKQERLIELSLEKYDRMCALIDDWQARNPISKG